MTDKKTQPLKPAPGPEKHPEIPDSVHAAASQVARNLLNSPSKMSTQIVAERQARKYGANPKFGTMRTTEDGTPQMWDGEQWVNAEPSGLGFSEETG